MTDIQIQKIISNGRLILPVRRYLVHYSASIFFSLTSIAFIVTLIFYWSKNANQKNFFIVVLMIFVLFPLLAIVTFINQHRNLKFNCIKTQFPIAENHKLVVQAFRRMHWKIKVNQKEFVEAYNQKWNSGISRTWGYEMISVVISEKEILINCICSVDTIWFQGALTFGKLKEHLNKFRSNFDILSQKALDHQDEEMIGS